MRIIIDAMGGDNAPAEIVKGAVRAKRELGMIPDPEKTVEERIRGRFVEETTHLKRRQERGGGSSSKWLIIIAVLLVALLFALLN